MFMAKVLFLMLQLLLQLAWQGARADCCHKTKISFSLSPNTRETCKAYPDGHEHFWDKNTCYSTLCGDLQNRSPCCGLGQCNVFCCGCQHGCLPGEQLIVGNFMNKYPYVHNVKTEQ